MDTLEVNLYDYPQYYDLLFGSDWKSETDFLLRCFRKHGLHEIRNVFEPACGTGRLLVRLARAGLQVSGIDINERSVQYCNDRLERQEFPRAVFVGDMTRFRLGRRVDAAFNLINSFRHLTSGKAAKAHLRCVADALRNGGVYVIGLHLKPTEGEPMREERWSASRGRLRVDTHMWTIEGNERSRVERVGLSYRVRTPTRRFRLLDEITFRTYTAPQFRRLVSDLFEIAAIYDFGHDIDDPI